MVYGRTRNVGKSQRPGERKVRAVPMSEWTWLPQPAHPALVNRETWEAAQKAAREHAGVRDAEVPTRQPGRRYALRSRMHCSQCGRRMTGITRTMPGAKGGGTFTFTFTYTYTYVLGHDRAAMLETHLPRTAADAAAKRAAAAELIRRIARNDAAAKGLIAGLAQLGDSASPASVAYRTRIREHFTNLHDETTALQAQLEGLQARAGALSDAALIDQIPYAPGLLARAPDHVRTALYAALDLHCTYRADQNQVTICAAITDTTPGIVAALTGDPRTDEGTTKAAPEKFDGLTSAAIATETPWRRGRGSQTVMAASPHRGAGPVESRTTSSVASSTCSASSRWRSMSRIRRPTARRPISCSG
jgi:hypothetical protein